MGDRRRSREDGERTRARSAGGGRTPMPDRARQQAEQAAQRKVRDAVHRLPVVRDSRGGRRRTWVCSRSRDADQRHPPRQGALELNGDVSSLPTRKSRAASMHRLLAERSGLHAASRVAGSAVQDRLRGADRARRCRRRQARGDARWPFSPMSTRLALSTSCTSTRPWNRRANSGCTRSSSSPWPARRASPPAMSSVCFSSGAPARSSSSIAAAIASPRGSLCDPGIGSAGGSTTTVARPPRRDERFESLPASGKRSASRTAAAMSAIGSTGGGGASTIASSPASTTESREPYGSGRRVKPA